jgi:hypothetical protein
LLSQETKLEIVYDRFPYAKSFDTNLICPAGEGSLINIKPEGSVILEEVAIVNKRDAYYRCKQFLHAGFFPKSVTPAELIEEYTRLFQGRVNGELVLHGALTIAADDAKMAVAAQLQSLYVDSTVDERLIDEFITRHPEILKDAFDIDEVLSQVSLKWRAPEFGDTKTIRPDFFLRRADGLFDILDLKLAKVEKRSLTTGGRERRRFLSPVAEGIAQLAHYNDYFRYSENRTYAKEEFGIEVENPRLTLVIGSSENLSASEIAESMRSHPGLNLAIVDYDTLVRSFISV